MAIFFVVGFVIAGIADLIWECWGWLKFGYFPGYNLCNTTSTEAYCSANYPGLHGLEIIMNYLFNNIPLFVVFFVCAYIAGVSGDKKVK